MRRHEARGLDRELRVRRAGPDRAGFFPDERDGHVDAGGKLDKGVTKGVC